MFKLQSLNYKNFFIVSILCSVKNLKSLISKLITEIKSFLDKNFNFDNPSRGVSFINLSAWANLDALTISSVLALSLPYAIFLFIVLESAFQRFARLVIPTISSTISPLASTS